MTDHVLLGRTGLRVSPLCYGTMAFGGDADEATSAEMYKAVRERGINFLDCADVYQRGRAEEILGGLMAHERDELVITTKCHGAMGPGPNDGGVSRRHMTRALENSLKRLGTDRVEVLFIHKWEDDVPMEEQLRSVEDMVRAGKVLHVGVSNWAAWQIAKGLGLQTLHGWSLIEVIQPMYNLVKRQVEVEILPLARAENIGVITYSPVGGGLLSGKYGPESRPGAGRLIQNSMYASRYGEDWVYDTAAAFTAHAREIGVHPVTLAVAWTAGHPDVTCPIIGARNLEQLNPSLDALDMTLTKDARNAVSALGRTPPSATDRREETLSA